MKFDLKFGLGLCIQKLKLIKEDVGSFS